MMEAAVNLWARVQVAGGSSTIVGRVSLGACSGEEPASRHALRLDTTSDDLGATPGYGAYLVPTADFKRRVSQRRGAEVVVGIPPELEYLADGDVVRISPSGAELRVMYRRNSPSNALLLTEQCNSYCVMCSQPPRARRDRHLVEEALEAIPLMSKDTAELGITGGEPTLLHEDLLRVLRLARDLLPKTSVHLLTNGRLFAYLQYARVVAEVHHHDLMLGIPLYSDIPSRHDAVVQARGAYEQTIRGILNLARFGQRVEIRVVINSLTCERLPELASFIARNLPFAQHVALMGLELTGHTRMQLNALWADPVDYGAALLEAAGRLERAGMRVSIYNHQLCTIPRDAWHFARRSISDWKNTYLPICYACAVQSECGGFFASSGPRRSRGIAALTPSDRAPNSEHAAWGTSSPESGG